MANLLRGRYKLRPPLGATIDGGHPLANGLRVAVLCGQLGIARSLNVVDGSLGPSTGSGISFTGDGLFGDSPNHVFSTHTLSSVSPSTLGNFSAFAISRIKQVANVRGQSISVDRTGGSQGIGIGFGFLTLENESAGTVTLIGISEAVAWYDTSVSVSVGPWHSIGFTYNASATTLKIYLNGRQVLSNSGVSLAGAAAAGSEVSIGGNPYSATRFTRNTAIQSGFAWTRTLSSSEMAELAVNPYGVFVPAGPSVFYLGFDAVAAPVAASAAYSVKLRRRTNRRR